MIEETDHTGDKNKFLSVYNNSRADIGGCQHQLGLKIRALWVSGFLNFL